MVSETTGSPPSRRMTPMYWAPNCVPSRGWWARHIRAAFCCRSEKKRGILRFALQELHRAAPEPTDLIPLPAHAPFGAVELNLAGCTLCLACVSACPTGALTDDPHRPMLRFSEQACVQCGLCQATCPEKSDRAEASVGFRRDCPRGTRILKEEAPFCCIRCSKPFGVKSTVERVVAKLEGTHWMYKGSQERK